MTQWRTVNCFCDECFHRWVGSVPFRDGDIPPPFVQCPKCDEMNGRVESGYGSISDMIGTKAELWESVKDKTREELIEIFTTQSGLLGRFVSSTRRLYQKQKDLVARIKIRVDEAGAWRIEIQQDEETKKLIGRLQIVHTADDIEWEEFLGGHPEQEEKP